MDLLTKLVAKMLARAQKGMAQGMQEAMSEILNELMKGAFDPVKLAELMKKMGVDPSQLSEMLGKAPGFDPYLILGLDKSASDETVKKRYREFVRRLHPDTAGFEGTSFLLQIVMAAYETIRKERGW
jgi:DnaJ-class molecular chaperone